MTTSRRMSLLDATFLRIETAATPMHVAGLMIFEMPADAGERFVHDVVARLRDVPEPSPPFNQVLARGPLAALAPALTVADDIDFEYHVRHTVLPAPGSERELGELVSHLHAVRLDRSRPLWTCHVIEGLEGGRFAIYIKIHHALADGVEGTRLVTQTLASTAEGDWTAPWGAPVRGARRGASPSRPSRLRTLRSLARGVRSWQAGPEPVLLPFQSPASPLNGRVTSARRVATQRVELSRVTEVARRSGASVNDVFLAICSGALRRHLLEQGSLPGRSMVAGVPVSLREPHEEGGNQVGFVWSSLGTDAVDAKERLQVVAASMKASKDHLGRMTPQARKLATTLTMAPAIAVLMSGLGDRVRPTMNITISNVPGPPHALYLQGARLRGFYPVSIPFQGQGLNITCFTHDGGFNIGFTGCRDSVPHLQRLAVYTGEALEELEQTFSIC